jgi:very-short-patch-repair endonuclease
MKILKTKIHNREVMYSAQSRASEMRTWPSPLEERMIGFLNSHNIGYETQKIFYIHSNDGWIRKYYIADFYIPGKCLILEVDGKFHDKQKLHDKLRTLDIKKEYPCVNVYRWRWNDFKDEKKITELLHKII